MNNKYNNYNQVHDTSMLLLKQERSALGDADEEYAAACRDEIEKLCNNAYNKHDIRSLLNEKEVCLHLCT
jgi:hypothetical protein